MDSLYAIERAFRTLGIEARITDANAHVAGAALIAAVLAVASLITWARLRDVEKRLVPSAKLTVTTAFELVAEFVLGFMRGLMGEEAMRYFPLIGSIFVYIFCCNLVGIIPGFRPPTENINTNLAVAVCVFIYYHAVGIRKHGLKRYLKHMAGPILWLAPLTFAIELVSHAVRPVSLSVRLFGNMLGDHIVLEMFNELMPVGAPIFILALSIFVAFIQAFVFSLLSAIYIALAIQGEDGVT